MALFARDTSTGTQIQRGPDCSKSRITWMDVLFIDGQFESKWRRTRSCSSTIRAQRSEEETLVNQVSRGHSGQENDLKETLDVRCLLATVPEVQPGQQDHKSSTQVLSRCPGREETLPPKLDLLRFETAYQTFNQISKIISNNKRLEYLSIKRFMMRKGRE